MRLTPMAAYETLPFSYITTIYPDDQRKCSATAEKITVKNSEHVANLNSLLSQYFRALLRQKLGTRRGQSTTLSYPG